MSHNTKEIKHAYKSKYNLEHENEVILLMITVSKNCHYLSVKGLSALLKGITSKHKGHFYCLNFFYSYAKKNKLEKHEKVCKDHDIVM